MTVSVSGAHLRGLAVLREGVVPMVALQAGIDLGRLLLVPALVCAHEDPRTR